MPVNPRFVILLVSMIYVGGISSSCQKKQKYPDDGKVLLSYQFSSGGLRTVISNRHKRAEQIKQGAFDAKVTNSVLLAGIASAETGLAHCHSEATWACEGPASSDCDGGPVIAGAGDGPCSLKQGGLCMFQFDSGTHSQTLSTYGEGILTAAGCTEQVVPFLVRRSIQSVDGVDTEEQAIDWMNSIDVKEGDPEFERWVEFVSWRYNGCKDCADVEEKYRVRTLNILDEFGSEFWNDSSVTLPGDESDFENWENCSRARLSFLPKGESLKLRTQPKIDPSNVVGRIFNDQVFDIVEQANGDMIIDNLLDANRGPFDMWLRITIEHTLESNGEFWASRPYFECLG